MKVAIAYTNLQWSN